MHYDKNMEKRISNIPQVVEIVRVKFGGSFPSFDRGVS